MLSVRQGLGGGGGLTCREGEADVEIPKRVSGHLAIHNNHLWDDILALKVSSIRGFFSLGSGWMGLQGLGGWGDDYRHKCGGR